MASRETIELLTERLDWVRALARRLVGDAHLAEDIAQEATVAALRDAPLTRPINLGWLAGIVRNVAANLRRNDTRRARHELQSVKHGEAPSAAQAAAFVEQQRLLADLVLELDPPFRDVVLLRFFEQLPRRTIARQLEIPVATVNSRLARAMAKLRTQLDARHGGERSTWVAALAPLTLRAPIAEGLTFGVLVMKNYVAAAAILAALLGAGTWLVSGFMTQVEPQPAVTASGASSALASMAEVQQASPPTRTEWVAPTATPLVSGPRLRVVDALTGAPEPAAEVRLFRPLDVDSMPQLRSRATDRLDIPFLAGERLALDEAASLTRPPRSMASLVARHGERMGSRDLHRGNHEETTLRLWPLHTVRVRVVDVAGHALQSVPVALRLNTPGDVRPCNRRDTDAFGLVSLRWFEPMLEIDGRRGRLEVGLDFPGGEAVAEAVDITAKVVEVSLCCPPVGRVCVTARKSDGTTPTAAHVGLTAADSQSSRSAEVLRDGRAEFWPVGVGCELVARVWHGGRMFTIKGSGPTVAGETVTLALDLGQSVTVVGRVLSGGQPRVNTPLTGRILSDREDEHLWVQTDDRGRFRTEVASTARAIAFELRESPNPTARVEAALPVRGGAQLIDLGDLELTAPPPFATGTVVGEDGAPLADAQVHVVTKTDQSSSGWEIKAIIRCDAQGRFKVPREFVGDDPWLQASCPGSWRHEPERCAAGARDVLLTLRRAGALAGQLRAATAVPLELVTAKLWDESAGPLQSHDTRGWQLASVDAEGRFRFDGLRPGWYTLAVSLPSRDLEPPLATITKITVGTGVAHDARLTPLDLGGVVRAVRLRVRGDDGRALRADAFARLGQGQARRVEYLGQTDRPLLLTDADTTGTIIVEADGYFATRVEVAATDGEVVLRRGTPVAVQVDGALSLAAPLALRASLHPVSPTATTRRAHGYRERSRPDHGFVTDGNAALRVPEPGDYRVRLHVQRDEGGYLDEIDVTPESAPIVRVSELSTRLTITVDTASVAAAVARIGVRKR